MLLQETDTGLTPSRLLLRLREARAAASSAASGARRCAASLRLPACRHTTTVQHAINQAHCSASIAVSLSASGHVLLLQRARS